MKIVILYRYIKQKIKTKRKEGIYIKKDLEKVGLELGAIYALYNKSQNHEEIQRLNQELLSENKKEVKTKSPTRTNKSIHKKDLTDKSQETFHKTDVYFFINNSNLPTKLHYDIFNDREDLTIFERLEYVKSMFSKNTEVDKYFCNVLSAYANLDNATKSKNSSYHH